MIVYKITNKINGKIYIGQTIRSLKVRWDSHYTGEPYCRYLSNSIKKYGKDAFTVEEIGRYNNLEDLNNAEEYYINWYNCMAPNGYNLMTGGSNKRHSEESKQKISKSNKGKNSYWFNREKSLEHRNKIAASLKGKPGKLHSIESKNKISMSQKKKKVQCIETEEIFESIHAAGKKLGTHATNICAVLKGRKKHIRNFTFKYIGDFK